MQQSEELSSLQMKSITSQIMALRRENAELRSELTRRNQITMEWFQTINRNLMNLIKKPNTVLETNIANHIDRETNTLAIQETKKVASLSKCPRSLYVLWQEFEVGLEGRKPAKDFTRKERGGRNKYTYHRRNVFWKRVAEMVRGGMDSNAACEKIYTVYGPSSSVTTILNQMLQDEKRGGHISLRVHRLV